MMNKKMKMVVIGVLGFGILGGVAITSLDIGKKALAIDPPTPKKRMMQMVAKIDPPTPSRCIFIDDKINL